MFIIIYTSACLVLNKSEKNAVKVSKPSLWLVMNVYILRLARYNFITIL